MKQLVTTGIVLSRTDYGEADRILTLLTPDYGKLTLMAKGVRRVKSKLAGGIELFSVSTVTFIQGRGDMGTMVSTRLVKYYSHIVEDLDRTMLGYDLIKLLKRNTEDQVDAEYFALLRYAFEALDDPALPLDLIRFWFTAQLLSFAGHTPNLHRDATDEPLQAGQAYAFDIESMCFAAHPDGPFTDRPIKFLRLGFAQHPPHALAQVQGAADYATQLLPLVTTMLQHHLRV
jgi:DNA repair protein RecO (recombination protein O)